ncbi:hypothetical protein BDZ97DRAFT_1759316 [Flammula alnicola]|nr:hypothetical protein BDZ97DRAFT_1759316 [Flammula alnicola]
MPSADGIINCTPENRKLTATFLIDGVIYMIFANFASSLPAFTTNKATITYDEVSQLTSTRSFSGYISFSSLEIKLGNGVVVSGILGSPLQRGTVVSGWGTWILN